MSLYFNKIIKLLYIINIIPKLGVWNFSYMLWYRVSSLIGIRSIFFKIEKFDFGDFYSKSTVINDFPFKSFNEIIARAECILNGEFSYFHYNKQKIGSTPNWFLNPFTGISHAGSDLHWTKIDDFNSLVGDIKIIWEISRFDWLHDLARAYRLTGDIKYLNHINKLLNEWCKFNPLNQGINWKCGQEASFRVMKLISTAQIFEQYHNPSHVLVKMVYLHLKRINGNIRYAFAQDNNHATSEAAALYIGSRWLLESKQLNKKEADILKKWVKKGRLLLEKEISKLVATDGTFSQKSINYHRVFLDTLSWVMLNMQLCLEPEFSYQIKNRLNAAGNWLFQLVNSSSGQTPNIGSNDGAMIETLHCCDYRDFRPSVQLFFYACNHFLVYPNGLYNEPLFWRIGNSYQELKIKPIDKLSSSILDDQLLIMRKGSIEIYLKIPKDDFRPLNDIFHIDIWYNDENIAIGPGTYSYNAGDKTKKYKSIQASNTVCFDQKEPMPIISRFLSGAWISPEQIGTIFVSEDQLSWTGSYLDYKNNRHSRTVNLSEKKVEIIDTVNTKYSASVNWHLNSTSCTKLDNSLIFSNCRLQIDGDEAVFLSNDCHSLYYMQEISHTKAEIVFKNQRIVTSFEF